MRRLHPASPASALQAPIPKQYLEILGQPIALYSLRTFAAMPEVGEIIVVCEPEYRRARRAVSGVIVQASIMVSGSDAKV